MYETVQSGAGILPENVGDIGRKILLLQYVTPYRIIYIMIDVRYLVRQSHTLSLQRMRSA